VTDKRTEASCFPHLYCFDLQQQLARICNLCLYHGVVKLDKFCSNQDIIFDYKAELTGIGSSINNYD